MRFLRKYWKMAVNEWKWWRYREAWLLSVYLPPRLVKWPSDGGNVMASGVDTPVVGDELCCDAGTRLRFISTAGFRSHCRRNPAWRRDFCQSLRSFIDSDVCLPSRAYSSAAALRVLELP